MFQPVNSSVRFPQLETEIAQFWKEEKIYEASLARREGKPRFVFYEGPPTANGLPHPGHCLTRAIKDVFPRYRTMRGYYCERKAGWDTHGLPVEVEVCKELGIHSKEEIENYGVEPFIHKCMESVFRYTKQWERLTERIGFWVDLNQAYVTYHQSYIESVWWALKTLFEKGLLYQGHKIVWWWAQGGTALSSGEVGQGYREVADPSVYVRFPLGDDDERFKNTSLLVWTTTPWTLPSNQFAAVHPELDYAVVWDEEAGQKLVIAAALVETIAAKIKRPLTVEKSIKGSELVGKRYVPPFDYYYREHGQRTGKLAAGGNEAIAWRVVAAEFVTTDSGSGVVHQAPAFGEVDHEVLVSERARFVVGQGPELICAVGPDGKFVSPAHDYEGRWVKECDKDICRELKSRGLLLHQEQYLHDYPFCWRADSDPLIQYPRKSWFIKTSQFKDQMLANNAKINWLPEHIKDGRFGNFLASNVDWALSRERYWGTPLPIWQCQETGKVEAVGSYAELLKKPGVTGTGCWEKAKQANPELSDHLKVHKPYIDEITYDSPFAKGAHMRRVPEVIDCWFDSGAMPFAQWGYPHTGEKEFKEQFPADFISEALDQTRGWFYSQLAISTLLFGESSAAKSVWPHPFRNCIVLGLMLGEDGQKMAKSKRNYREPGEIFDKYGADALRWYLFANQPPWTSIRYNEQSIKDSVPEFLLRLWNVYSFFVIYAQIDDFSPAREIASGIEQLSSSELASAKSYRPAKGRSELDRWILSELERTVGIVTERMDAYDNYAACGALHQLVDALSNWYVRRSRDRFWAAEKTDPDKLDAYWTLYECLLTTAKLVAPFTPFVAEAIWKNLAVAEFGGSVLKSVHLCDYPTSRTELVDANLSAQMNTVREIVSLGRSARVNAKLKVRQPLARVEVILADATHLAWLREHAALIAEELNVKEVEFAEKAEQYIDYTVLPDLKKLGPRIGKQLPALKGALAKADAAALLAEMERRGSVALKLPDGEVTLDKDDLQIRLSAKPGWAAAQGISGVVVLATELTPELIAEGYAREVIHHIQTLRKERNCEYTDRIEVGYETDDAELTAAIIAYSKYIQQETLTEWLAAMTPLSQSRFAGCPVVEVKVGGATLTIFMRVVKS
jgi:isoleucyl-tRNA synthetase